MDDLSEFRKNFLHDEELFSQADPEDIELAFQLQNFDLKDVEIFKRVIYRYSSDLYRWIKILLCYQISTPPDSEEILDILKKVYNRAFRQVEQFHGQASVIDWLFAICIGLVGGDKYKISTITNDRRRETQEKQIKDDDTLSHDSRLDIDNLPEKLCRPMLLRYLYGKSTTDIAYILNIQKEEVHHRLVKARKLLRSNPMKPHLDKQIQAFTDGMLDGKQDEEKRLVEHVTVCDECKDSFEQLIDFERSLAMQLKASWDFPQTESFNVDDLIQSIIDELSNNETGKITRFPLRNSVWFIGISILFVGLAILFIQLTPMEREFPLQSPATKPELPSIVEMRPNIDLPLNKVELSKAPRYVESDFSSDGNWGVISSIRMNQGSGVTALRIELYNRSANTFQVIQESTGRFYPMVSVWDLAPSISADGRRIVYVSSTNDVSGSKCKTIEQRACLDLFLFDRDISENKRLTQATDGSPANGDSLSPTISKDGKWVAFWSKATNLLPGNEDTCQEVATTKPCIYIFLLNIDSGNIQRIPIGTTLGETTISVDRISLSADGRYVGFTISIEGKPLNPPNEQQMAFTILGNTITRQGISVWTEYKYTTEALVYDRISGAIESVNLSPDGNLTAGASSSPVLSADGRYVAFASYSSDLVDGDINYSSDVFLRDRDTGKVELVSVDANGVQGKYNSGVNQLSSGSFSIDLSSDGRYVIFESNARNLGQRVSDSCRSSQGGECTYLYVRDIQTKRTELIDWLPYHNILSYPHISMDGRWISFIKSFINCGPFTDICSNLLLYDQANHWTKNLTNYREPLMILPWAHQGSIPIPWQLWESKSLSISSDGKFLALGGLESKVRIWKTDEGGGETVNESPYLELDSGNKDYFSSLQFRVDNRWLAAGTVTGSVYIWDIPQKRLLYTLNQPSGLVKEIIFSQDNKHLIISTNLNTTYWFIGDKQLVKINTLPYDTMLKISPDGNLLASKHEDGTIWIQRLQDGRVIARLGSSPIVINSLAISSDNQTLAICSADYLVSIWHLQPTDSDTVTITPVNTFQMNQCTNGLMFSPDNRYLLLSGTAGDIFAWSVPGGQMYRVLKPPINSLVYSLAFSQESDMFGAVVADEIILWRMHPDIASNFFVRSSGETFIDSDPQPKATAIDIPEMRTHYGNIKIENLNLEQVVSLVDFPPLVPTKLPESISFQYANVYEDGSLILNYKITSRDDNLSTLNIYEKLIGNSPPLTMIVGLNADIIPMQLMSLAGRTVAEFVKGDWLMSQSFTTTDGNALTGDAHEVWRWDMTSNSQRLRWQQYGILIGIYYQVNNIYSSVFTDTVAGSNQSSPGLFLNNNDLLEIASSMRWLSQVDQSSDLVEYPGFK